jgi:hypothetical protein
MNAFEKFIHLLQYEVEIPKLFGAFHLVFLALTLCAAVTFVGFVSRGDDKRYRKTLFVFWVVLVVFEIYRELVFSLQVTDGVAVWDYAWYLFPFQLCATPLYIFPLVVFLPEGRVRQACKIYLSTFALFGGLVVMIYPGDVFCYYLGVNIQSLIHHGLQLVGGVITVAVNRENHTLKNLYKGAIVFLALVSVAMLLNVGVHAYLVANQMSDTFNMFFISPYFPCTLPILSLIYPVVPYPVFLLIYVLGFCIISVVTYYLSRLVMRAETEVSSLWKKAKVA